MTCTATPLLTRLRRHRGLWALAVAVLLIKLVSSSVCASDDPAARLAAVQTTATTTVDAMATVASDDAPCLLGEAGDCHCACAHAATLTMHMASSIAPIDVMMAPAVLSPGLVPATTGSLLRPPIA